MTAAIIAGVRVGDVALDRERTDRNRLAERCLCGRIDDRGKVKKPVAEVIPGPLVIEVLVELGVVAV
jgi:hypothetical protein